DHELPDLSPAGVAARADLARATLAELDGLQPIDEVDAATLDAMRERLGLAVERHEAGEGLAPVNNLHSPVPYLRDVLDLMPTDTEQHWADIAARVAAIPAALAGYTESLRAQAASGRALTRRQVRVAVEQSRALAGV